MDGRSIPLKLTVPAGEAGAESVLPGLWQFSEQVADGVEEKARADGRPVSCSKGCGACCRQPVPVTRAEARQLLALVEALPAGRRNAIRERCRIGVQKARGAGLTGQVLGIEGESKADKRAMARAYFEQGIACPFLEDESCSIHPFRPLVCREYLVSSSPEHCARLDGEGIERLPFPAPITAAFGQLAERDQPFMLIISIFDWAESRPEPARQRTGPEWLQAFFQLLAKTRIPDPSPWL